MSTQDSPQLTIGGIPALGAVLRRCHQAARRETAHPLLRQWGRAHGFITFTDHRRLGARATRASAVSRVAPSRSARATYSAS